MTQPTSHHKAGGLDCVGQHHGLQPSDTRQPRGGEQASTTRGDRRPDAAAGPTWSRSSPAACQAHIRPISPATMLLHPDRCCRPPATPCRTDPRHHRLNSPRCFASYELRRRHLTPRKSAHGRNHKMPLKSTLATTPGDGLRRCRRRAAAGQDRHFGIHLTLGTNIYDND
jgi:hypothetical protein